MEFQWFNKETDEQTLIRKTIGHAIEKNIQPV
ncbi:hypothetical protein BH10BAC2_BH10BAC2_35210 [soil metagenome]